MLISVEHEMPAVSLNDAAGVLPKVFIDLWDVLVKEGWDREATFAVSRLIHGMHSGAKKPSQTLTTDSGPTIEIAPSPGLSVMEVEQQLTDLHQLGVKKLGERNIGLLGSGVHPFLGTSETEYSQFRTPRIAYDYSIRERGWEHRSILNIAAMQEVIDISTTSAPEVVAMMHKLAGALMFLCRNDPDYANYETSGILSVRPGAWRKHIPPTCRFESDRKKMWLPAEEIRSWRHYLRLLWEINPMFLIGTKNEGLVYVPQHPTFADFLISPPSGGWEARRLDNGESVYITPTMEHVAQTDWTYMGFARLRLFWKKDTDVQSLVKAYQGGDADLDAFLEDHVEKVLLENRSSATPPPGEEMCSLALVAGLIENFDAVKRFVEQRSYAFWLSFANAAEYTPLSATVEGANVAELLTQLIALASQGLSMRGRGENSYLEPLYRRIRDRKSPSEYMLEVQKAKGMDAVVEKLLYRV